MTQKCTALSPPIPSIYAVNLRKPTTEQDITKIIALERDALAARKLANVPFITKTELDNLNELHSLDPDIEYSIWFTVEERVPGENLSVKAELVPTGIWKYADGFEDCVIASAIYTWERIQK